MQTYFAPAERASDDVLQREIELASKNPVVDGLMNVVSGFLAVLNEHRQILTLNEALLNMLGIEDLQKVLGLRPGEALDCTHAYEAPNGCGTTEFCPTCGAAIAIVTSLKEDRPVERICAVTVYRQGKEEDLYLRVRSCPITFGGRRLLLLFLQDVTKQQHWAALERVFFHDLSNLITGLEGTSQLLTLEAQSGNYELATEVHQLALRLVNEITIQRCLAQELDSYQPVWQKISVRAVLAELQKDFAHHPVAKNKLLSLPPTIPDLFFTTDFYLLIRVLDNMVKNAFEATQDGGEVKVLLEHGKDKIIFCVWNKEVIPEDIAKRVFQRNFSTKQGFGRGLGTYSMKLFGEQFLGGKVSCTTSEAEGTMFRLSLNVHPKA